MTPSERRLLLIQLRKQDIERDGIIQIATRHKQEDRLSTICFVIGMLLIILAVCIFG